LLLLDVRDHKLFREKRVNTCLVVARNRYLSFACLWISEPRRPKSLIFVKSVNEHSFGSQAVFSSAVVDQASGQRQVDVCMAQSELQVHCFVALTLAFNPATPEQCSFKVIVARIHKEPFCSLTVSLFLLCRTCALVPLTLLLRRWLGHYQRRQH
jgi:hypothetical protein